METFNIAELEESYTDRAVVNESNKKDTVYKGNYNVTIKKVTLQVSSDESQTPGRKVVNLQVAIAKGADKVVTQFVRVSPDVFRKFSVGGETTLIGETSPEYDKTLPLDSQSKLWGHIESIMNPKGTMTKAEVVKSLPEATFQAYILEGFADDKGGMAFPDGDPAKDLKSYEASRNTLMQAGMISKNFFSSFRAVKG